MRALPPFRFRPRTCALLLAALVTAQGAFTPASAQQPGASEAEVQRVLSTLAADSMQGRGTATPGAAKARHFIAAELARMGVPPAFPTATDHDSAYFQRVPLAMVTTKSGRQRLGLVSSWAAFDTIAPEARRVGANVVGVLPGSDPALADQVVVVAAHYDHLGIGRAVNGDSIYNGADDDASGVTAVLEVARALTSGPRPKRTVVFMLTTGEEHGLLGTRWYLQHPVRPLAQTVAELETEMIGRPDSLAGGPGRAWLTGYERSSMGKELADAGVPIVPDPRPAQHFFERSDNIGFACLGIPAHTLSTFNLHADYHRPSDEVSRIDFDHMTQVIDADIQAVRLLTDGPKPAWNAGGNPQGDAQVCRS